MVEAIGPVRVELWVRASSPYFDVLARVCDVDPQGVSWNVCDALAPRCIQPFRACRGRRVARRLQPVANRSPLCRRSPHSVAGLSGAHPRYARNLGTGEDPMTATELRPVDLEVLHGADQSSILILPLNQSAPPPSRAPQA